MGTNPELTWKVIIGLFSTSWEVKYKKLSPSNPSSKKSLLWLQINKSTNWPPTLEGMCAIRLEPFKDTAEKLLVVDVAFSGSGAVAI